MTKYVAEVQVEVELDDTDMGEEEAFDEAFKQVDVLMQRAWDTDQGRHHVKKWHFTMLEGAVEAVAG